MSRLKCRRLSSRNTADLECLALAEAFDALILDRVRQHADPLDVDLADVALLHPHRVGLAGMADARRRAGEYDVAGLERDALGHIGDGLGHRNIMLLVLSDCMTWPLRRVWIFRPLPPGGSSSAVTSHGPKPPVRSKFLPMSHCVFLSGYSSTE